MTSLQPILRNLELLEEEIVQENEKIIISLMRIEQNKANFMLSYKMRALNTKILKNRILAARQRIKNLKTRKTIFSIT